LNFPREQEYPMTEPHPFDLATALEAFGEGQFNAATSKPYANMTGPFGGVTSASMLRAVLEDARRAGDPVSMTVNFCAALKDGAYTITTRLIRSGKYIQHWAIEVVQNDITCTTASVICGRRLAEFSHQSAQMPDVPPPRDCTPLTGNKPLGWLNRYDFRYVEGQPDFSGAATGLQSPKSVMWVRDAPDRALDYLSLAALSDSFILRLLHLRPKFVPMGTVSLTTHFMASGDEIAEQGSEHLLGVSDAMRFHGNFHDQHMQLFGKGGRLLASGSQIVWFKA
jgi:acyl-CoA thioesterase